MSSLTRALECREDCDSCNAIFVRMGLHALKRREDRSHCARAAHESKAHTLDIEDRLGATVSRHSDSTASIDGYDRMVMSSTKWRLRSQGVRGETGDDLWRRDTTAMTNVTISRDVGDGFDFIGLDLREVGPGAIA